MSIFPGPQVRSRRTRSLDLKDAHFAIEEKVGPLDIAKLRAIGSIGKAIPDALSVPDPVSFQANADGTPSAVKFHVESDLTGNRIAWADALRQARVGHTQGQRRWVAD